MPTVRTTAEPHLYPEATASGISWAAVIGGAFVTAALWLTLTILGLGLGLSAVSPWAGTGASSKAISVGAIVWLIVSQIIASSIGGYLAGRLRIKWPTVHVNEVYFRDTAHGFLVWAVAVVASAAFLSTALTAIAGSGIKMAPPMAAMGTMPAAPGGTQPAPPGGIAPAPAAPGQTAIRPAPAPGPAGPPTTEELDQGRKAAATTSIWIFVALLIGAFCASVAATIGGRLRDAVVYVETDAPARRV